MRFWMQRGFIFFPFHTTELLRCDCYSAPLVKMFPDFKQMHAQLMQPDTWFACRHPIPERLCISFSLFSVWKWKGRDFPLWRRGEAGIWRLANAQGVQVELALTWLPLLVGRDEETRRTRAVVSLLFRWTACILLHLWRACLIMCSLHAFFLPAGIVLCQKWNWTQVFIAQWLACVTYSRLEWKVCLVCWWRIVVCSCFTWMLSSPLSRGADFGL